MSDRRPTKISFDPREDRRDRRYPLPPVSITIDGVEYTTVNWSLGGFLLKGELGIEVGATISGTLRVDGSAGFPFTAELIWREVENGSYGFHFTELTPDAVGKLDRALARRLVPRARR